MARIKFIRNPYDKIGFIRSYLKMQTKGIGGFKNKTPHETKTKKI